MFSTVFGLNYNIIESKASLPSYYIPEFKVTILDPIDI